MSVRDAAQPQIFCTLNLVHKWQERGDAQPSSMLMTVGSERKNEVTDTSGQPELRPWVGRAQP